MPISPTFISCGAGALHKMEREFLWQKNGQLC